MFYPFAGWTKTLASEPAPFDVVDIVHIVANDVVDPSERDIA
jgi:hypothetical protein